MPAHLFPALRRSGLTFLLLAATLLPAKPVLVFVGALTNTPANGIYEFRFDPADGTATVASLAARTPNPSWLAFDASRRFLYTADSHGGPVSAFAIDPDSGALAFINSQPTGGPGASVAHLIVDRSRRLLIAPDYRGGGICTYPIAPDGKLRPRSERIALHGPPGPDPKWQTHSFPHGVALSPDNRFAYVFDRGLDRIFIYAVAAAQARLIPAEMAFAPAPRGAGPRHGVFSPDGKSLYVVNELANSVTIYGCEPATGALTPLQTVSTLPADDAAPSQAAEIQIRPDGRFLYVSNRGPADGSLAVFARHPHRGSLELIQTIASGGSVPRHFTLDETGRWLLCANQESGNIAIFRIDPATGRLTATGRTVAVPRPLCVLIRGSR
jgi:6-phosphogluconolactonase